MQIEKGIPIPQDRGKISWPFKDMDVNDCVKFPDKETAFKARNQCHIYGDKTGKKFVTRTIDGVLHVWRVI